MGRSTQTQREQLSTTTSQYRTESQSQSQSASQSETKKVLDQALRDEILAGLMGYMTNEEIDAYAENLLRPQKDAQLEAAQQEYETAKLLGEQEIEDMAAQLSAAIGEQRRSYAQSSANVQTAALARGMGRSSYTLDQLSLEGEKLARAVQELTQENERKSAQVRSRIAQQAQQSTQTQNRVNTDYAAQLAAKVQEIRREQAQAYNQNYLAAVSGSMGSSTSGQSSTQSSSVSSTTGTSQTRTTGTTSSQSGSSGSSAKKKQQDTVDAVSSAAKSVTQR